MVRKLIKCQGCGKEFWTKQTRVYVFKEKFCPHDKSLLQISPDCKTIRCMQCGFTANQERNPNEFTMVGIRIAGSSRDVVEAQKKRDTGTTEVIKEQVNEADLCQACQNFMSRRMQMLRNKELQEKKGISHESIRMLTDEENAELLKMTVYRKINTDAKIRMQEEDRKKKEEVEKMIREKQAKEAAEKAEAQAKALILNQMVEGAVEGKQGDTAKQ